MKRIQMTIARQRGDTLDNVAAYELPPYHGIRFAVLRHPLEQTWRVSEVTTGCKVSPTSTTRKGALALHEKNLARHAEVVGGVVNSSEIVKAHIAKHPTLNK